MQDDWSDLPEHILGLIVESLPIVAYTRFGCAAAWRSAADPAIHPPTPHQAPWLMLPGGGDSPTTLVFTDRTASNTSTSYEMEIPLPELRRRLCIGSSGGLLVFADHRPELHLLNPITGVQLELPSITTFPFIEAVRDSAGNAVRYLTSLRSIDPSIAREMTPDLMRRFLYKKAIPFFTAARPGVVLVHSPFRRVSIARVGDKSWTPFPASLRYPGVEDVAILDGQVYTLDHKGVVRVWNISGGSGPVPIEVLVLPPSVPINQCYNKYLVRSHNSDLLQVLRDLESDVSTDDPNGGRTREIHVQRFDTGENRWVKVENIGNHAIFIGTNQSIFLSARDTPTLNKNCIYYIEDDLTILRVYKDYCPDVGVYNMGDGSLELFFPCQ